MNEKINKSNCIMGLIRRTFTYIDAGADPEGGGAPRPPKIGTKYDFLA